MVDFNQEDYVAQLPCNHCFNKEAIMKWVTTESATCPICRYKLKSKEVRIQEEKVAEAEEEISQQSNEETSQNNESQTAEQETENWENAIVDLLNPNNLNNNAIITEFLNLIDQEIERRTSIINSIENDSNDLQQAILNSLIN